jgi:hypothetical protein
MRTLVAVLAVLLLTGCPKKKGDEGDAASDAPVAQAPAEDAAPPPPALPTAKNEADVARFKGETSLGDDDAKIAIITYPRTAPTGGTIVATLKIGTEVGKVASYQNSILITFVDPKDPNTTLMGWVGTGSFLAPAAVKVDAGPKVDAGANVVVADAGPPPFTCGAGTEAINLAAGPACKKKCATDADCKNPTCSIASALHGGRAVRVCVND